MLNNKKKVFLNKFNSRLIHSTSVIYMDPIINNNNSVNNNNIVIDVPLNNDNIKQDLTNLNTNNLQLELYNPNNSQMISLNKNNNLNLPQEADLTSNTNFSESFDYLMEDGQFLNFNETVGIQRSVQLIANYLEKKYGLDEKLIDRLQIKQFVDNLSENKDPKIIDLFNEVRNSYNLNPKIFSIFHREGKIENSTLSSDEKATLASSDSSIDSSTEAPVGFFKSTGLLGKIGERSVNYLFDSMLEGLVNINATKIIDGVKATGDVFPLLTYIVGFSLYVRTYMKHIYNRPLPVSYPTWSSHQKWVYHLHKNRNLAIFCTLGIPLMMLIRKDSLKDSVSATATVSNPSSNAQFQITSSSEGVKFFGSLMDNNPNITKSSLFLIFTQRLRHKNKIPSWLKLAFNLLIIILLIIKLSGFNFIDFSINTMHLKYLVYILCSVSIAYQLLNLFLLFKYGVARDNQKVIPNILPDFFISWLNEFNSMGKTPDSFNAFKNLFYTEILVYIIIIIVTTLL